MKKNSKALLVKIPPGTSSRIEASGNGKKMKKEEKEILQYRKDYLDTKSLVSLIKKVFKEMNIPGTPQQMDSLYSLILNRQFAKNTSYLQKMFEVRGYIAAYMIGANVNKV